MRSPLLACLMLAAATGELAGQMGPFLSPSQVPQAKTQDEYDVYLNILTSKDPQQTISQVDRFAHEFPKSQLLGLAFEHKMLAYQKLQDWANVFRSGQRALQLEPRNVMTSLTVAAAIINGIDNKTLPTSLLDDAEQYSAESIQELGNMTIPHEITLDRWERMRGNLEGQAHELLGEVAVLRGKNQIGRREFEAAIHASPNPRGMQFLRLGLLSQSLGNDDQASQAFRRAMELGPDNVRKLAKRELQKVQRASARQGVTQDRQAVKAGPPK